MRRIANAMLKMRKLTNMSKVTAKLKRILREEGFWPYLQRSFRMRFKKPRNFNFPVKWPDAIDAFKIPRREKSTISVSKNRTTLGWVMPPPSPGSGGHQNMFRFIKYAENAGFNCRIYFYVSSESVLEESSVKEMLRVSGGYPEVSASMEMFERNVDSLRDLDALFASSWETAYGVQVAETQAKRLYFVQDFEPYFYPVGSHSILAEKTYDFGFVGLTAGGWLAQKLKVDHQMETYSFDFAVERTNYFITNPSQRDEIFFYARPSTDRRGFELGLLALSEVIRQRPNVTIHFAGELISKEDVPFRFVSHGILSLNQLRDLYNQCAAGLVISTTNMSLLPLELLACGVVPVVNKGENNSMVSSNKFIRYIDPSPVALSETLLQLSDIKHDDNPKVSSLNESVRDFTWEDSGEQFLLGLRKALYG
jgi:hypothetical protein